MLFFGFVRVRKIIVDPQHLRLRARGGQMCFPPHLHTPSEACWFFCSARSPNFLKTCFSVSSYSSCVDPSVKKLVTGKKIYGGYTASPKLGPPISAIVNKCEIQLFQLWQFISGISNMITKSMFTSSNAHSYLVSHQYLWCLWGRYLGGAGMNIIRPMTPKLLLKILLYSCIKIIWGDLDLHFKVIWAFEIFVFEGLSDQNGSS